ncbi:hypothetical protein BC332_05117 [Capsicum chinense]|nr:hypothetical protein BC332_05117 [Capsicum chinense]
MYCNGYGTVSPGHVAIYLMLRRSSEDERSPTFSFNVVLVTPRPYDLTNPGCSGPMIDAKERKDSVALASPVLVVLAQAQGEFFSAVSDPAETYLELVFKNKVEAITVADKKRGRGDGSAGMFSWLVCRLIHKQKGKLLRSYRFMNQELQDSGKELSNRQSLFLIPQFSS